MAYRVTALYEDAEVGFGEGESYEYAAREAAASVPTIYPADDVVLSCTSKVGGLPVTVETPLSLFREVSAEGFSEAELAKADLDYLAKQQQRDARRHAETCNLERAYVARRGWAL